MNFLKVFIIISLIISTIWVITSKPATHKHFIVESSTFKLENNTQIPENLQSTILFKLGNTKTKTISKTSNRISQNTQKEEITRENKIIPSTIYSTIPTTSASNTQTSSVTNSNAELQQVENMLNNTQSNWTDLEQKLVEERENRERLKRLEREKYSNNYNHTELRNNSDRRPTVIENSSSLREARYRNELITWNEWRSNIQNRIMDDSNVFTAHYGTIFFFSFNVNKHREISNVKVVSTEFTNTKSIAAVKEAILNLEDDEILEFPKNSTRDSVGFTGGFIMGSTAHYSTPDNYNDYENIRVQY